MADINKWKSEVIKNATRSVVPIMTCPGVEICGYTLREAVSNGKIHAEVICKLSELYPSDALTSIMDLTVEAEAFGAEIIFPENEIPSVVGRLVEDRASIENLKIPSLETARVPEYLKADRLAKEGIKNKPVFGGCIGPFSLAGRLFGLSEMMMALYTEPEAIALLLKKCTAFLIQYCQAIKETGVDGVVIAEPAAGLISNEDCIQFSTDYVKEVVRVVQDDQFLIILHNCGNPGHATDAMIKSEAGALHFGNKIDMIKPLDEVPKDILVMGNIDPVGVMKLETAENVYNATLELLKQTAGYPNFVLSTGCDVPPGTPPENIYSFYKALKDFNKKKYNNKKDNNILQ